MKFIKCFILIVVLIHKSTQDVYMHNPRGSNNRLNEKSANRANANRLFDSQVIYSRQLMQIVY